MPASDDTNAVTTLLARVAAPDGKIVLAVMPALEVCLTVPAGADADAVFAHLVDAARDCIEQLDTESDNRDFHVARILTPQSGAKERLASIRQALAVATGESDDPLDADWAVRHWYSRALRDAPDAATPSSGRHHHVTCALGRRNPGDLTVPVSFVVATTHPDAWTLLQSRGDGLARRSEVPWRWITLGLRCCPVLDGNLHEAHLAIRRVAPRMPAVDVGDPLGVHVSHFADGLRTIGATTWLAPELVARCPLESADHSLVAVDAWGQGIRVETGRRPDAATLRAFVAVDTLLRPARTGAGLTFPPPWDDDSTASWLDRWQRLGYGGMPH
ncbi:MAG: hypothetical protein MUE41_06750 [Gemmatimonadaceae bacterium]|nr:hypothetical protein [Gemmatimonadaceae bacterium]